MTRDMNLIRTIVLHVRDHGSQPSEIAGQTRQSLAYHCWLVFNAQLADGADATLGTELGAKLYSLTWSGQNFADAVSSESVWKEAMKSISKATMAVSFEALMFILAQISIERVQAARNR